MSRRLKRGFAMGYAIALMSVVLLLVVVLLTTAQLTGESSVEYRSYLEEKHLLDDIAASAEVYYGDGGAPGEFDGTAFADALQEYGFSITQSAGSAELYVLDGSRVALYLKFDENGTCTARLYNAGTYAEEAGGMAPDPGGEA